MRETPWGDEAQETAPPPRAEVPDVLSSLGTTETQPESPSETPVETPAAEVDEVSTYTRTERTPLWEDPRFEERAHLYEPPSQQLQAKVSDRYAREGPSASMLRLINTGRAEPVDEATGSNGRNFNCAEVARAVAMTIEGYPRAAAALHEEEHHQGQARTHGEMPETLTTWAGVEEFPPPADRHIVMREVLTDLADAPDGAHGFLGLYWESGGGHVVNVVRDDTGRLGGEAGPGIYVVDAQWDGSDEGDVLVPLEDYLDEDVAYAMWRRVR